MGRPALVIAESGIDLQALAPDLLAQLVLRLDRPDATALAADHDLCFGVGAEVVVPARMAELPEVGGDDREAVVAWDA